MFKKQLIVSALELGTSKISVLIGESTEDGRLNLIGKGIVPSAGAVVKGEIVRMDDVIGAVSQAIIEADRSSGGRFSASRAGVMTVTGCAIDSVDGVGNVFIRNEDCRITQPDLDEAHRNARIPFSSMGRVIIGSSESYFMLDDQRKIRHPLNQAARKVDAHIHIVHGNTTRLENFRNVLQETEFAERLDLVFAPIASAQGILSREERDKGVLLIDFGAGVTEYLAELDSGILASGQLQIGFDHVINDLGEAFKIPREHWRKLCEDGSLTRLFNEQSSHLEIASSTGKVRKIPVASIETVVDLRLRELFEIIHRALSRQNALNNLAAGGVLTGGGALFERSVGAFQNVFNNMTVRVGRPIDVGGSAGGIDNARFSTVWGALKIAESFAREGELPSSGALGGLFNHLGGFLAGICKAGRDIKESIKL